MKFLVDTHLLLWAGVGSPQVGSGKGLSKAARKILEDDASELYFSAAVIWEVAIKSALGRPDFDVDPGVFRTALLGNGYQELQISGAHAVAVCSLEDCHGDPFDRIQIAQATVEGMELLTHDPKIAEYTRNPIRFV